MDKFITWPESNILHLEESPYSYCPGGFHPVCLGDEFQEGRYRVVHKLGFGGFSTVWLARDTQDGKWVALKILNAKDSVTESIPGRPRQVSTLEAFQDGHDYIPVLYDKFYHSGPNGSHLCMVTEFLGPSLRHVLTDYYDCGDRFEPDDILWLSRQLLQATASLHAAGFAHGDLSAANIVFTAGQLTCLSEQALLDIIGHPETAHLLLADGSLPGPHLPKQLVGTAQWEDWIGEFDEDICLVDFGESFRFDEIPSFLAQPGDLRVPETIFSATFDYKVDLWRLGCVIYALVFASYPFQSVGKEGLLVAQMNGFVEDLPPEWEGKWQTLKAGLSFSPVSNLESQLDCRFRDLAPKQLAPLLPVIRGLMKFRPEERMSASDALTLLQDLTAQGEAAENLS